MSLGALILPVKMVCQQSAATTRTSGRVCMVSPAHSKTCVLHRVEVICMCVQSCPTLCNRMDYNLPGSSVHGILQARILEWVAVSFSKGSSCPRDQTQLSCLAGDSLSLSHQGSPLSTYYVYGVLYVICPHRSPLGMYTTHVWMWELDYKESWVPKNWCFWIVVLKKTLESLLDCKEIQGGPS